MSAKAIAAEFIGTFTLVFIGAGAAAVGGDLLSVALAHGLVVLALATALGPLSGAHLNPAVTLGAVVARRATLPSAGGYWLAQLAGGIVAAALLLVLLPGGAATGLGATHLAPEVSALQGIALEAVLTFFLVSTIAHTALAGRGGDAVGAAIGLTLVFCILMGGPLTGASLNPARSLGPALFTGELGDLWVYFVGPLLGAAVAAALYRGFFAAED